VRALFAELRGEPRIAALTACGAVVAGGRIARADAVVRFAPRAHGQREPRAAERIDLLLTTDLLSEGINLQDASVVVHLDLPWTPARVEQRVGRLARLGATHERVAVYIMRPPAAAGSRLAMERRLRAKLAAAARVVGIPPVVVPGLMDPVATVPAAATASIPATTEEIRALLARWRSTSGASAAERRHRVAVCRATGAAWIALVGDGASMRLVASVDGSEPTEEPDVVLRALTLADDAASVDVSTPAAARAVAGARTALACERSRAAMVGALELSDVAASRARREVMRRIASIASRAPLGRRAALAPLLARARVAALAPCGLGGERRIGELATAVLSDETWLDAVIRVGGSAARRVRPSARDGFSVRALLVVCPD
jgi:hypothetical protein